MENYKIKVNNEAESKEAQELFFELGGDFYFGGKLYCNTHLGLVTINKDGLMANLELDGFDYRELTLPQLRDLVAQSKSTEQGLISGADAKLAWAKGEDVQLRPKTPSETWEDLSGKHSLDIFEQVISYDFRLKPKTIKLELEIPAPFELKEGEKAYRLAPAIPCGYTEFYFEEDEYEHQFGAWRTELEIKQVVAALRGAIKLG